jgi:ABC-type nitrate/sulfonate/bicarbonate transport system substrate-binding protein
MDCATLAVAQEMGLFRRHGLEVRLSREVGWASVREKLLHGELEGAVAHACLLFSIYFGLGCVRRPCLTGLMLGHHGSAITVSRDLWQRGVRDARTLGEMVRGERGGRPVTFGMVLEFSVQHLVLDDWLRGGGMVPGTDVRLTVIPSGLIHQSLAAGHIDGYCVGEPWNSAAALAGDGVVVAATGGVSPGHPDKALVVLQECLLAALLEASRFCAAPANRRELARMLSAPAYLGAPEAVLWNGLGGDFETGAGRWDGGDLIRFDAATAGAPDRAHGRWVLDGIRRLADDPRRALLRPEAIRRVFREDLFHAAARRLQDLDRTDASGGPGGIEAEPGRGLATQCGTGAGNGSDNRCGGVGMALLPTLSSAFDRDGSRRPEAAGVLV